MIVIRAGNRAYDSLLTLVYPQRCAICAGSVESRCLGVACDGCWQKTRIFAETDTVCWKCGLPTSRATVEGNPDNVRCRQCDDSVFLAARSCGAYEGALRASILALKHSPNLASQMVELLSALQKRPPLDSTTLVVPVPLHPTREKARGFNQAAVIGRALSNARGVAFSETCLVRTQHTDRHRAGMDAKDRHATVANAFQVSIPGLIAGERVLLVDDVFTTGATASSCAQALLAAGAAEVCVLTIARPVEFRGQRSEVRSQKVNDQ